MNSTRHCYFGLSKLYWLVKIPPSTLLRPRLDFLIYQVILLVRPRGIMPDLIGQNFHWHTIGEGVAGNGAHDSPFTVEAL